MVAEAVPCGPDIEHHLQAIRRYEDAGFEELYIQQIGSGQERFFEVYSNEILPIPGAPRLEQRGTGVHLYGGTSGCVFERFADHAPQSRS